MQTSIPSAVRWGLLLLMAAGSAHGDAGDVFNLSLGQSFGYDSNLFKLAKETDATPITGSDTRADRYASSMLRLTADKLLGRQVLHAAMGVTQKRYDRFVYLDSNLGSYSLGWDWQLGHPWSGSLTASRVESEPGFDNFRAPVKDVVTTDTMSGRALLMIHPDWRLVFGAGSTRMTHEAAVNAFGDSRVNSVDTGLRYVPGNGKEIGLRLRRADASYPNQQTVVGTGVGTGITLDNSYREDGSDLDLAWETGGASHLQASLGWTNRRHKALSSRDVAGRVSRLNWGWAPTGKTNLGFSLRRELSPQGDQPVTSEQQVKSLTAGWQPTGKLGMNGTLEYRRRDHGGDPQTALSGQPARRDDDRIISIGASYAALRDLQIQATWREERRDSDVTFYSYVTRQVMLSVNLVF